MNHSPAGTVREDARPRRRLLAVVAIWLLAALAVPLFPDEYYYWTWSRHLAAGYFDHPPAIAWLIRLGTSLFGVTRLGVRAPSLMCGVLTLLAVDRIAGRLAGPAAGRRATLLLAATPLITGAFILGTPDAPLLAASTWSLYAVLRAIEEEIAPARALAWWAVAGVLFGLAGLSKYTAVLVPAGMALTVALHRPLRRLLATPGPYLGAVIALAVVSPVVGWNAAHTWVSFRYQLAHGLGSPRGGTLLDREVTMVAQQFLAATPILLVFLAAAVWRALRRRADPRTVLLGGIALFIALFFGWSGRRRPVEANWLALAYPAAVVLLASWPLGPRAARWLRAGTVLSVVLSLFLLIHLATPLLPLPREPLATSQAFGWSAVASAVERAAGDQRGHGGTPLCRQSVPGRGGDQFPAPHPPTDLRVQPQQPAEPVPPLAAVPGGGAPGGPDAAPAERRGFGSRGRAWRAGPAFHGDLARGIDRAADAGARRSGRGIQPEADLAVVRLAGDLADAGAPGALIGNQRPGEGRSTVQVVRNPPRTL